MIRALNGSPEIAEIFKSRNLNYDEICIYKTDFVKLTHVPKSIDIIIFTSASTVKGFAESVKNIREVRAVCIGRQTAEEAERQGFINIEVAEQATMEGIFNLIMKEGNKK